MGFNLIVATCRTNNKVDSRFWKKLGLGIGGIGFKGELPWPRINKDLNFFKNCTTNKINLSNNVIKNVVIMGRKTWESIPVEYKPLSDRINIVISRTFKEGNNNDFVVFNNLNDALSKYDDENLYNIWIIGGTSLYNEAILMNNCKNIFITKINNRYNCDTLFGSIFDNLNNEIENNFIEKYRTEYLYQDEVKFRFSIFTNKNLESESNSEWINNVMKNFEYKNTLASNFENIEENMAQEIKYHPENQYLNLIKDILKNGRKRMDRTGTGTYSVFGRQLRFNIRDRFPILTTKRVYWKGVVEELLWFLKGDTNINHLIEKNVHIWDGNSTREYLDKIGLVNREERDGGPIYGFQWRHFGAEYGSMHDNYDNCGVDQFAECLNLIKNNPESRRIIMSAWNPSAMDKMCLPPCHVMYQFYVNVESNEISCHMYQRSADVFLGLPFNICSTALLTHIMAKLTNRKVGDVVISLGDAHIYSNHVEQCNTQIERIPRNWPKLDINVNLSDNDLKVENFEFKDFILEGYSPHPTIKAEMAV